MFLKEKTNRRPPGWDRAEPADGSCVTPAGLRGDAKRDNHQKEDDPDEVKHLSVHFSLLLSVPTQPARTPRVDDDPETGRAFGLPFPGSVTNRQYRQEPPPAYR